MEGGELRKAPRGTSGQEAPWVRPVPSPHTFEGPPPGKAVRPARDETKPIAPLLGRPEGGRPAASGSEGEREASSPPGMRRAAGPGRAWGCLQVRLRRSGNWPGRAVPGKGKKPPTHPEPRAIPSLCLPPLSGVSFGCAERLDLSAACVHPLGLRPSLGADPAAALGPR